MNSWRSTFAHMRWPLHTLTLFGLLFATLIVRPPIDMKLGGVYISWLLLSIGITLFNDYYDKDTQPVAGLDAPPPVTEQTLWVGLLCKAGSLGIAVFITPFYASLIGAIALLTMMYSHPHIRIKKNPFGALGINAIVGFAAFIAVSSLQTLEGFIPLGGATLGIGLVAVYLLMQLHQVREDAKRGDTSLTSMLGIKKTSGIALGLFTLSGILGSILLLQTQSFFTFFCILLYFLICMILAFHWWTRIETTNLVHAMKILLLKVFLGADILLFALLIFQTR